jgi:hypothetical protein
MKKKFLSTTLLVCFFVACLAAIADVSGKWTGVVIGPDGNEYPLAFNFKVDGTTLTGTSTTSFGESAIEKGKVKGDSIYFSTNINGMDVPQNGKVFADSVSLNIDYGGTKLHSTLKRAAEGK